MTVQIYLKAASVFLSYIHTHITFGLKDSANKMNYIFMF